MKVNEIKFPNNPVKKLYLDQKLKSVKWQCRHFDTEERDFIDNANDTIITEKVCKKCGEIIN